MKSPMNALNSSLSDDENNEEDVRMSREFGKNSVFERVNSEVSEYRRYST